jgi:hypothetical protein
MTRTRAAIAIGSAAGAIAAALAVAAPRDHEPPPVPGPAGSVREQLIADRHWLDLAGERQIGPDYACAQLLPRRTLWRPRRIVVYVTSREAAARAERVRRQLQSAERTTVRLTSPRFRAETMRAIREDVQARLPPVADPLTIGTRRVAGQDCPSVAITIRPRGQAKDQTEQWVADAIARHGRDRIVVLRTDEPYIERRG